MSDLLHDMSELHMAQYARCFEEVDLVDFSNHPAKVGSDFQQSLHFCWYTFRLGFFLIFFFGVVGPDEEDSSDVSPMSTVPE